MPGKVTFMVEGKLEGRELVQDRHNPTDMTETLT